MRFRIPFFCVLISLLCRLDISAQTQVYPVQVTGSLIPPHSLDLKSYGTDRSADLTFNALLKDPTQAFLSVVPRITIEQSGTEIYGTDPNFFGEQLLLSQFENQTIDGVFLNNYLSNAALSGKGGQGMGSVEIPEGFNQVCLQFYGVDRNVAVSNKFCVSGNFRLNQPPQIVKPAFNEKIKIPPVQNTIFSWQPMHLGSGNNPGMVEYTFEIVELPIGVMNANDVFESALKIYNTNTTATSILYTQAEPILEAGKIYAWRVTAKSVMYPTSKLFQNDGKSEVSTFIMYDGDVPSDLINPLDNPAPRGCSVFETSYGPVIKADNQPSILIPNQTVKVGYFNMITSQVNGGLDGYSGTGWIEYPMLRSKIEVTFDKIKVNKENRVYEADRISAVSPDNLTLKLTDLNKENISQSINSDYINKLNYETLKPKKDVAKLVENGTIKNNLPLVLKYVDSLPAVTIIGIEFTPQNAYLTLVSHAENNGIYAATAIPATPYGIKSNAYLVPIGASGITENQTKILESIELGAGNSEKSKLYCDCKGTNNNKIISNFNISPQILQRTDNGSVVTFETDQRIQDYNTHFGKIKNIPEFRIEGLKDFKFKAKSGLIDLSYTQKDQSSNDAGYIASNNNPWKGVILKDVTATLPEKYNILNKGSELVLDKGTIYIDDKDIAYGTFLKTNVLNISKGKMGPWNYSIDSMMVSMTNKQVGNFNLSGKIKTPFFDDNFPYHAIISESKNKQIKLDATVSNTKLRMSIWHGNFNTKAPSEVDANLVEVDNEKQFIPKCNFTGDLSIRFTDQEFRNSILNQNKGETIDALKNALKVDNLEFDLSQLQIKGLIYDPFKEKEKRYKAENFELKDANISIGGGKNKLSDASLEYVVEDQRDRLGLKTIIVKDAIKIELIIWAQSINGTFKFEGIEVNNIDLKCNCSVAEVTPTKEAWDKIIENFYEKNYSLSSTGPKGGSMSINPADNLNYLKELTIQKIRMNAIGWFPSLDNNSINIPFLDRNLNIENKGGSFVGKYRDGKVIDNNTIWTKQLFDGLVNETSGELNLPIILTNELWSKFGFKGDFNLPDNYKLIISEFKSTKSENINIATIKIGLIGDIQIDGTEVFIYFGSKEDIAIGPDKVALKDLLMHLSKNTKLNDQITYLSSGNGDKTSELGSYVRLDCTGGVNNFNLQGNFTAGPNTIVSAASQNSKEVNPTVLGFKLIEDNIDGNDELLSEFIAPIKTIYKEGNEWKSWSFSTEEDQHITFDGGDNFEAYLDYSSSKAVSSSDDIKAGLDEFSKVRLFGEYFKGVIFNKVEIQIPILEQKRADKNAKPETFKDFVNLAFYEMESNTFNAKYQGIDKVLKENNAKLGGWQYQLDTLSFNIEYNTLDEDKLSLKGSTRIPIFKEAPQKDKDKWLENYSDAWVPYSLNVEYDKKEGYPVISGFMDGIEESLFESKHIDGLGLKLDEDSSVEFNYDSDQNRLIAKACLSGRSIYYIEKLDAKIPLLKFQDFKLNYNATGLCKSNDGDGIESIDFGDWGIIEFTDAEKSAFTKASAKVASSATGANAIKKVKENKFAKSLGGKMEALNKLAGFDVNIHEPKFECTGNDWKLYLGLDLSIMRDKSNLTETQKAAYDKYNPGEAAERKKTEAEDALKPIEKEYKDAQNSIKTIADARSVLLKEKQANELQIKVYKNDKSFKINGEQKNTTSSASKKEIEDRNNKITELNKKIAEQNIKYKAALATVKDKNKPFKDQSAIVKTASNEVDALTKAAVAKQEKYDKSGIKDRLKQDKATFKEKLAEAKETKTGAFSASGDIEVTFNSQGYKDVALTCLALGGEFGPIKFDGGINLFRDDTNKSNFDKNATQTAWGNGFLGMIRLKVLEYEFATKFQTGIKLDQAAQDASVDDFRYWFADLSFNSSTGLPLGQTSFSLTGLGGGFYYNMAKVIPGLIKKESAAAATANNDHCKAEGMEAGKSLSGMQYTVKRGSMGGYLSAEISHVAKVSLEAIVNLEIEIRDGSPKFKNFGLGLNGYALYEDYWTRKTNSTAVVKGQVDVNFEENIQVVGGIDFRFGKKAGPLTIESPEGKDANPDKWNSIKFLFSKDVNYVHIGGWGIDGRSPGPKSGLNFLTAGFEAPLFGKVSAGLYAQIGNQTDGLPSIQYLLPDYNGSVKKLKNSSAFANKFAANAGFKLNAEFGNEF